MCPQGPFAQQPGFQPKYEVGQLIQHRRYAYRGVIAALDASCIADDDWYLSNQTQPDRDQPWYHVIVHGSHHTTYVAEENVEVDHGGEQVVNPLARELFEFFHRGRYQPRQDAVFRI
ncbi:MAG: heat shock protein HspQ [Planctomycetota bacterium]